MASMHLLLVELAKWEILVLLGGLAALITVGLLTRRINTHNLLRGRRADQTLYYSPERVQLLVATIGMALQYLLSASQSRTGEMPQLPDSAIVLLGLSNLVYLGAKGWNLFQKRQN